MGCGDCENLSHSVKVTILYFHAQILATFMIVLMHYSCCIWVTSTFRGHDIISISFQVPVATDDVEVLQRITKQLFGHFSLGKLTS